ncbi:MAG: putative DsbA family dithiol-disulfide isomerase [Pseudohongiellaceae bacterium]
MSIDKLKQNYPVQTRWIHFPLHPETPVEGQSLAELFAGRDISEVKKRLQGLMAEAGLPYGNRTHTFNSRLAQELGKWADTQEGGDKIHDLLYRAYFVDNVNIGDVNELVKVAAAAGLDEDTARQVIVERQFEAQVDEDWKRSRAIGVTGVPTFYANEMTVVGCQPYDVLEKFVKHLLSVQLTTERLAAEKNTTEQP